MNPLVHLFAAIMLAATFCFPVVVSNAFSPSIMTPLSAVASPRVRMRTSSSISSFGNVLVRPSALRIISIRGGEGGTNDNSIGNTAAAAATSTTTSLLASLSGFAGWIGKSKARCWTMLMVSITVEICATTLTKVASDSADARKLAMSMSLYIISLLSFTTCLPKIEVGVAYAVWSALGTAIVSAFGMIFFNETCNKFKIFSLALILVGVIGLNLSNGGH